MIRDLPLPADALRRLTLRHPDRYPVLLDSTALGALARVSILAVAPQAALWRTGDGTLHADRVPFELDAGDGFLQTLERWLERDQAPPEPGVGGFHGGWIVFLGYEMAGEVEPHLDLPGRHVPGAARRVDAFALRCPAALVRDAATGRASLQLEADAPAHIVAQLHADLAALDGPDIEHGWPHWRIQEENPELYLRRVLRAQEYIRAGDIYQANLSRWWRAAYAGEAPVARLYARLCNANPGPFAALGRFRDLTLLSSSPERLLRIAVDASGTHRIDTRPIAGTHARSEVLEDDRKQAAALLAHPKERAEHIMLIDLERNDLGRVCRAGTIEVDEYMAVETYAHVHHIVSNVRGVLREGVSAVGALRAVFPGGTITGCPKFRCMQIIAELEGEPRGAYTGSLGYINRDGSADFNILIRTMTLCAGSLELRAGAGIVADSQPARELDETRAKARGLLTTLVP
jgi:anthranilate synthase component 1